MSISTGDIKNSYHLARVFIDYEQEHLILEQEQKNLEIKIKNFQEKIQTIAEIAVLHCDLITVKKCIEKYNIKAESLALKSNNNAISSYLATLTSPDNIIKYMKESLYTAVKEGNLNTMEKYIYLVEAGSLLSKAIDACQVEIVKLLWSKMTKKEKDKYCTRQSVVDFAIKHNHILHNMLIECLKNKDITLIIESIITTGNVDTLKLITICVPDICNSLIHYLPFAAEKNRLSVIKFIYSVSKAADNRPACRALQIAITNDNKDMIDYLIKNGACILKN